MGRAIDSVLAQITNSAALAAASVAASGDTLQVKNFDQASKAYLENITVKGTAARTVRVLSPSLHDPVRGITFVTAQAPSVFAMPREVGQPLQRGDVLTLQLNSGATDSTAAVLQHYYENLPGAQANLVSWSDIAGYIDNIKPVQVAATSSATIGAWNDVALNSTEDLLHADTWYAVLGYVVDVACLAVSVRGPDTGNLRISGPGSVLTGFTGDYFVTESDRTGRPHIPLINSNNKGGTTVSTADNAASTAVQVQLILAELHDGYTPPAA